MRDLGFGIPLGAGHAARDIRTVEQLSSGKTLGYAPATQHGG